VQVSPNEGGDVYVDGVRQRSAIQIWTSCGDTVELEAAAEEGYWFAGWKGALSGSESPITCALEEDCTVTASFVPQTDLYFPHVDTTGNWGTEICLINKGDEAVSGELTAYTEKGDVVSRQALTLSGHERRAWDVARDYADADRIRYMAFSRDSRDICGYTTFYQKGLYRVAVPAVQDPNTGDIYVPHIDSSDKWWTGLALVNTTDESKRVAINFNNGAKKSLGLAAGEHKSFTIKKFFGNVSQPDIKSAVIKGGGGIIGLELFSQDITLSEKTLSGVLLKDEVSDSLYFPHIVSNDNWWTGLVAYNPNTQSADLTITSYTKRGNKVDIHSESLEPGGKYIGDPEQLDLARATAWVKVKSSRPLNGFELFGHKKSPLLAGYSAVNISRGDGVFPKLEYEGWTGIAFINATRTRAKVDLSLYADDGTEISTKSITLDGYEKIVDQPEDIFGGPFTAGTYLKFRSAQNVVGFQLNGSDDGTMLDAMPGM
jgi:hypothetical protein